MSRLISTESVTQVTSPRFEKRSRRCASGWIRRLAASEHERFLRHWGEIDMKRKSNSTEAVAPLAKAMRRRLGKFGLAAITPLFAKPAKAGRLGTDIIHLFPR